MSSSSSDGEAAQEQKTVTEQPTEDAPNEGTQQADETEEP